MMHLNSAVLMGNRVNVTWSDGVVEEFPTVRLVHVDLDEFLSKLRVPLRRSNSPDECMRLGPGATA